MKLPRCFIISVCVGSYRNNQHSCKNTPPFH